MKEIKSKLINGRVEFTLGEIKNSKIVKSNTKKGDCPYCAGSGIQFPMFGPGELSCKVCGGSGKVKS